MDTKKRQKLIRTLTDALYELFATEVSETVTKAPKIAKAAKAAAKPVLKSVPAKTGKKSPGPKKGAKAPQKPCPVTGILNTHRRYSYLMPEARTPENLAKYKGASKAKAA